MVNAAVSPCITRKQRVEALSRVAPSGRLGAQRHDVAGLQGVWRGVELLGPKARIERLQRGRLLRRSHDS